MAPRRRDTTDLSANAFGKLVTAYREQREWSQEELAERWGYSREYVSQIERGKRKPTRVEQVNRLADILEIPQERLDAIGKDIPQRQASSQKFSESDDVLFQAILQPALTTVKLSWLVWYADRDTASVDNLSHIVNKLQQATSSYGGSLLKPAQQVLAYAYEMKGKIAFDHLDFMTANGYFDEMHELGQELNDPDIIALALIYKGDILRKRGRYELAIRCLNSARPFADVADVCVQGLRWNILARAHSAYGQEAAFLKAIDKAQAVAIDVKHDLNSLSSHFSLVDVLQERAQGHTMLWQPQKALAIYRETDRLRPFRPMRSAGSYVIVKAQAHAFAGDVEEGVKLAIHGLELAKQYQSQRHISRIQTMYNRLAVSSLRQHPNLKDLKEALSNG